MKKSLLFMFTLNLVTKVLYVLGYYKMPDAPLYQNYTGVFLVYTIIILLLTMLSSLVLLILVISTGFMQSKLDKENEPNESYGIFKTKNEDDDKSNKDAEEKVIELSDAYKKNRWVSKLQMYGINLPFLIFVGCSGFWWTFIILVVDFIFDLVNMFFCAIVIEQGKKIRETINGTESEPEFTEPKISRPFNRGN